MKSICITLARTAAIAVAVALAATTISANAAKIELVLYGVYAFDPSFVTFNQHVMPTSIPQVAEPYVLVPDGNPHTYVLSTQTVADGDTTVPWRGIRS